MLKNVVWNQTLLYYCIRVRETCILSGNYETKKRNVNFVSVLILNFPCSSLIGQSWEVILCWWIIIESLLRSIQNEYTETTSRHLSQIEKGSE